MIPLRSTICLSLALADPKAAGSRFECVKLKSPCSRGHHHNTPERVGRFWVAFPVLAAKNTGATSAVTVTLPAGQASASDYPSLRAAAHSEAREPDSEKPVGWPSGNSISSVSPPSILLMRTEDSDRAEHSLGHGQCGKNLTTHCQLAVTMFFFTVHWHCSHWHGLTFSV